MKKRFIALFISLLMILTSVNIVYAETTTASITGQPLTIKRTDVKTNQIFTGAASSQVGFINFDLTEHLPKLYLSNSVKLSVKSAASGQAGDNWFSLEIIPDSMEEYITGKYYYNAVVDAGVLSDGVEILSARRIGSSSNVNPHITDDFKDKLIKALESGDNNNLSVRLVLADLKAEDINYAYVGIQTGAMLDIEYDSAAVSDEAYYLTILENFNLEEKAGIDLANITSDFILPTYYKGSKISW